MRNNRGYVILVPFFGIVVVVLIVLFYIVGNTDAGGTFQTGTGSMELGSEVGKVADKVDQLESSIWGAAPADLEVKGCFAGDCRPIKLSPYEPVYLRVTAGGQTWESAIIKQMNLQVTPLIGEVGCLLGRNVDIKVKVYANNVEAGRTVEVACGSDVKIPPVSLELDDVLTLNGVRSTSGSVRIHAKLEICDGEDCASKSTATYTFNVEETSTKVASTDPDLVEEAFCTETIPKDAAVWASRCIPNTAFASESEWKRGFLLCTLRDMSGRELADAQGNQYYNRGNGITWSGQWSDMYTFAGGENSCIWEITYPSDASKSMRQHLALPGS